MGEGGDVSSPDPKVTLSASATKFMTRMQKNGGGAKSTKPILAMKNRRIKEKPDAFPKALLSLGIFSLRNDCLLYRVPQADPVNSATCPLPNARPPLRMLTTTPVGLTHFLREQPDAELSETRR